MKTSNYIAAFLFLCGAALGILLYREFRKETTANPQQLTLEQILSIRELHLVKHTYTDLFFIHKIISITHWWKRQVLWRLCEQSSKRDFSYLVQVR